jgi:hypothetical protein
MDYFERSMALRPSALTRYSLAVVQERNRRLVESIDNLHTFIREADEPEARQYVLPAQELLRDLERRVPRLRIRIPGEPRGADVRVGHARVPEASLGVPRVINPGTHRVRVSVHGYEPFSQDVTLGEGEARVLVVRLEPLAGAPDPVRSRSGASGRRTVGVGLLVGGGAALASGLTMGILGYRQAAEAGSQHDKSAVEARKLALAGDITMGAGVLAAGIGTWMLLTVPSRQREPALGISGWTPPGGAGVTARYRW